VSDDIRFPTKRRLHFM